MKFKPDSISLGITDRCCKGNTGCEFDGNLKKVKAEPIFTQKVYDATLVNLQALSTVNNVRFTPDLGRNARIVRILDIRCRRFFNPGNINDPRNLVVDPDTILSGGQFVKDGKGKPVEVVGPDGFMSEKIIFADTTECDEEGKGTPVFGTQRVRIRGNVIVEIDAVVQTSGSRRRNVTLTANVSITPVELTNFFELCIPSVFESAFFPRFAEFCNILCETRLATNSISRDISIDPETGEVRIDLLIAICIACEKKIIVPVQLCVLSTGFPELSPEISPVCTTFPSLFPRQIDENSIDDNPRPKPRPRFSLEADEETDVFDYEDEYEHSYEQDYEEK
ncbi:hypothetical protein [Tepidimicrobium xylanilyticum]|uniref:Uncharacterized protein n=1 Tax=Tepidimicrobium xylanilyticum TaxID=1123352 RepID=A0A1H2TZN5_9FIRM|nr:hypothetical protein [Tepidimicrobium xylanilyticum]GMG98061.1 hypothetical protein EN5CB1_28870 [Tepidimicrobium xylanilyticum]SDW49197.1 hypothetical protein SAMN05660923_00848 [Tepidimicrobium xylanilyticum]